MHVFINKNKMIMPALADKTHCFESISYCTYGLTGDQRMKMNNAFLVIPFLFYHL